MTNHLIKRGSRYSIRRKIPLDLQDHYGRKEIVRALGTSDPTDARARCRAESVKLDEQFEAVRAAMQTAAAIKTAQGSSAVTSEWTQEHEEYEREYAEWLETEGQPDPLDMQFAKHDEQVAREAKRRAKHQRQVSAYEEALRRIFATPNAPALPVSAAVVTPPKTTQRQISATVHLSNLVERWAKERSPERRTVDIANRVIGRFWEHCGRIPVAEITRAHVVQFKDKLLESGQTPTNTNKQLTILSTLLNYAANNLLASSNAAKGIKVEDRRNHKEARQPFDLPALRGIFSSAVYTQGERPGAGAGEASYWLPLLALLTGARLEELAQLRPEDVYEENYHADDDMERSCWVMRITDAGEGQAVKNVGSVRRFPIHPELIERGFVRYAQSQSGKPRIFDKLKVDTYGTEGGLFGKWFSKYLRGVCGVTDKRMVFHSFRHGFKDLCRHARIEDEVSDALSGHASGKVSRRYGATAYPLAPLVEAVAKIRIPGLALPPAPASKQADYAPGNKQATTDECGRGRD